MGIPGARCVHVVFDPFDIGFHPFILSFPDVVLDNVNINKLLGDIAGKNLMPEQISR